MDEQTFRNLPVGTRLRSLVGSTPHDCVVSGPFDEAPIDGVPIGHRRWACDAWSWEVVEPVQPEQTEANMEFKGEFWSDERSRLYSMRWNGTPNICREEMNALASLVFGPDSEEAKIRWAHVWCERNGVTDFEVHCPSNNGFFCHHGRTQTEESLEAKHRAWIASLKPGDEVEVLDPWSRPQEWRQAKVTGRGMTGMVLADGILWCDERVRPVQPAQKPEVQALNPFAEITFAEVNRLLAQNAQLTTEVEALQRALAYAAEREAELSRQLARERMQGQLQEAHASVFGPDDPRSAGLLTVSDSINGRAGR